MAIDFPNSPSNGTQFAVGGVTWEYDGSVWNVVTSLHTILNGSGAPSSGIGGNGDFYIDTANTAIYGPKTAGAWGSPTSLNAITTGSPGTIQPDDAAAEGSSASLARADHTHAIAAAAASSITGSNAEGSSTSFARADHNHALGAGVVGTTEIADGAVTQAKLAEGVGGGGGSGSNAFALFIS